VIGATGNAARMWERGGRDDVELDAVDRIAAAVRRHPARAQRVVVFLAGVIIAATGLLMGTVPGWTHAAAQGSWPTDVPAQPLPVAAFPVLLLGLALTVGAVGSGIAALWRNDSDVADAPDDDGGTALVVAEH
jgi:TRAP-type C4-dicarboxylate transport system permease small subunit